MTIYRRGDKYCALVYNPITKSKDWVGTFDTEHEAEVAETRAKSIRSPKRYLETCDAFAERWTADYPRPARSTNTNRHYALRRFVRDFEGVPLVAIDRVTARQWALKQPLGTVDTVRTMFNDAINDGLYVGSNPFASLRRKRSRGRRDLEVLADFELDHLVACAAGAHGEYGRLVIGPMIVFESYVGARPAELFFASRLAIHGDEIWLTRSDDGAGMPKLPKNDDGRRAVLLPPVLDALELVPPRIDTPWLFYTPTGRRFRKSSLHYWWDPVRRLFGRPDLDFYELRHYCGAYFTNELEARPEDTAIQFGHKDGGHLVRTLYGHPEEKRARERLKQAYRERMREARDGSGG